jgi:hypothetical protein
MISTAWYDLTSRLQSNHVVLQRKDQPKSWLNKQRQMVNGKMDPLVLVLLVYVPAHVTFELLLSRTNHSHAPKIAASRPVGNPGRGCPGTPFALTRWRWMVLARGVCVERAG